MGVWDLYPELTIHHRDVGDPTVIVANAGVCRGKPVLEAAKRDIELLVSYPKPSQSLSHLH